MRLLSSSSGFGLVYEAYQQDIPKILKVLKPDRSENPKVLALFKKEAAVLSQLNHPGVPLVEKDGYFTYRPKGSEVPLHCILMEKIDGPNLQQWMQQQGNHPIGEKQAFQWLSQLTEILRRVHQHNYFHRDIKPDNVMLRATGQLVLVDFGAAREMSQTYLAQVGSLGVTTISSAGYTPPEQEQGQAVPQSDFYALGRTIIFLLTGRSPNDTTLYDPMFNTFKWRAAAPQVSEEFANLLDSLIATRVIDRPKTAQEILDRLHQLSLNQWMAQGAPHTLLSETTLPMDEETVITGWRPPALQSNAQPPGSALRSPAPKVSASTWMIASGVTLGAIALLGFGLWLRDRLPAGSATESTQTASPSVTAAPEQPVNLLRTFTSHQVSVNALHLLASKQQFISASGDQTLRLWDLTTGKNLQTYAGHTTFVNAIALSPDEKTLYSSSADGKILQWEVETGKQVAAYEGHGDSPVVTLTRTPDGQRLVSSAVDGTIKIWDTQTQRLIDTLEGHQGGINALVITDDGQRMITGGADSTIRLWSLTTGDEIGILEGHNSPVNALALSPGGQLLFSGSADSTIKFWDLETAKVVKTLTDTSYVNVLVVSWDGKTLTSGNADGIVRVWDVDSGELRKTYTGFGMTVDSLLLPSENQIVTGSEKNPAIKAWSTDP